MIRRYIFEKRTVMRIDEEDVHDPEQTPAEIARTSEENARMKLPDEGFDWTLLEITDVPPEQMALLYGQ